MKTVMTGLVGAIFLAAMNCAQAQETVEIEVEVEREQARAEAELSREEAQQRLREARKKLEEAAMEIAELSARVVGDGTVEIMEFITGPRRAMLGVNIGPGQQGETREDGVRVLGVTPGGPAAQAGIRSGDLLLEIGETTLDWADDSSPARKLLDTLGDTEPGTTVELSYRRDGEVATASVETRAREAGMRSWMPEGMELPQLPADAPHAPAFVHRMLMAQWGDMELVELTPELGEYFESSRGVLVVRAPEDPMLGLQDGDVILDIAGREPADPGHVIRILRSYAPGERLVMTVVRKGERRQLEADIPE